VSLQLAGSGVVESVLLADKDPLIAAFWRTATQDTDWLVTAVEEVDVTLDNWKMLKTSEFHSERDLALQCLFLNRTSFSGILHDWAGPLGGKSQDKRTIDCRFPKNTIIRRLRMVGDLARSGSIRGVWNCSYEEAIGRLRREKATAGAFVYMDPPFFAKSQKLYRYSFTADDHIAMASFVRKMRMPFLLSYDNNPEVRALYNGTVTRTLVSKEYRASAGSRRREDELIVTNISNWRAPDDG
jgi:DNA adenine methylase